MVGLPNGLMPVPFTLKHQPPPCRHLTTVGSDHIPAARAAFVVSLGSLRAPPDLVSGRCVHASFLRAEIYFRVIAKQCMSSVLKRW